MVHCEIVKRDSKRFIVMLFKYNLINRSLNYQGSTDYFGCFLRIFRFEFLIGLSLNF